MNLSYICIPPWLSGLAGDQGARQAERGLIDGRLGEASSREVSLRPLLRRISLG